MENKALKTRFILPPNVNGRCRGRLSLCLHEIKWYSAEPFQFNWIQAKLIWWGDKYQSGVTIKLKNKKHKQKSFGHAIHYDILTKLTLFKSYLLASKSIELKLSSGISNVEIARANIPIPLELIAFIDDQLIHGAKQVARFRQKSHLFNGQKKIMGEILVDYEMNIEMSNEVMPNNKCSNDSIVKCGMGIGIENDMNQFNVDLVELNGLHKKTKNKLKFKTPHKERSTKTKVLEKLSTTSMASPLLNYLTGRPLGMFEENEAVKAMESTSPTESLIDLLSFDLNGLYLPKKKSNVTEDDDESNILMKIDCLRLHIYDFHLTRAGTREILSNYTSSFSSGAFTVDVEANTILRKKTPSFPFTSKITRIFSSSIDALPPSIEFNRASIYRLNTHCMKNRSCHANERISLVVKYRDIESSESRTLGAVEFRLADVLQSTNLTFQQQSPVKTETNEIVIGRLAVKVELGCRGLHFGADFLDAISNPVISASSNHEHELTNKYYEHFPYFVNEDIDTGISHECCKYYYRKMDDLMYETSLYDIHDEHTEDKSGTPSTPINIESRSTSNSQKVNSSRSVEMGLDDLSRNNLRLHQTEEPNVDVDDERLRGLFHIGSINFCSWFVASTTTTAETFLVCRPFWTESALVTEKCQHKTKEENFQLDYLELFSVIFDQNRLIDTMKHGFMSIEVWQRHQPNRADTLVGSTKIPLHQFFIAFNNTSIRNHVSEQELPVISIDGWVTINYAAPSSSATPLGTVQAILAVGTTKQINNLQKTKSLEFSKHFLRLPIELYVLPTTPTPNAMSSPVQFAKREENAAKAAVPQLSNERRSNLAAMFSSFIDNLASRLPERQMDQSTSPVNPTNDAEINSKCNNSVAINAKNQQPGKYMRPTSELLDELQRALAIPRNNQPATESKIEPISAKSTTPMFPVHMEIESALHLPSMSVHVNKKSGKRNRNSMNAGKKTGNSIEVQPSTYVTFEASASAVASNLTSYSTNIVESSCSPQWNKHFEVYLPADFLQNDEKRFVIHVWRKINNDNTPKARLIPNSSNDVKIGNVSVDLSVLTVGLPSISGWFNIIDHAGYINGQIKIHIKPKDDVINYQKRPSTEAKVPAIEIAAAHVAPATEQAPQLDQLTQSLQQSVAVPAENQSIDDSALSRALKRKFTELEEITQRLRARLFDVTGNMTIDPDDQFEDDLNMVPDEDGDDFEESNIASEMSLDWLEHCQNQASKNKSDDLESSIAAQMKDIFDFDFLSPVSSRNLSTNQTTSSAATSLEAEEPNDLFNNQRNDRFNAVLNDDEHFQNDDNDATEQTENSVRKIAETLEKSIINDH